MPDWSYQPLFRPLLFRLPPATARDLTLGAIGRLAELPLGSAVIRFMGHMEPPATLKRTVFGLAFPGPVGLGAGLDAHAVALPALAQFGFGFLEVGPVTVEPVRSATQIERRGRLAAIWYPAAPVNDGLEALAGRLAQAGSLPVPVGVRLAHRPGADAEAATVERRRLIARLAPYADFFALDTRWGADGWSAAEWAAHLTAMRDAARDGASARPLLICLAPDLAMAAVERLLAPAVALGVAGVMVGGGVAEGDGRLVGAPAREPALRLTRALRERWGDQLAIVAAGGVQQPADALRLLRAGATLVQVHSGLVYAGPGLPKRINEAVAYAEAARVGASDVVARPDAPAERVPGWLWLTLLGAGMILGGVLAWQVAATRVVLPYDETFVGLSRAELLAVNARLLAFMAHDRVTLAGTMISIGVLYAMLALHGVRRAMHWAWKAIAVSGAVGFASFFLAFGFGYFDPLHALVTVALLPFFLFGLRGRPRGLGEQPPPNLRNDARWRVGLWGQLLFVALGVGLTLSGAIIAAVGVTTVFVPEDLGFLGATAAELQAANPRLLPLIAHDRAGFGGALASNGLAVLLPALWGFRQGARWLWWALLAAGAPGFAAALGVHVAVGYLDAWHLAPAATAALLYLAALILSYPYLCARPAFGR